MTYPIQLKLDLLLHSPNILHGQSKPIVHHDKDLFEEFQKDCALSLRSNDFHDNTWSMMLSTRPWKPKTWNLMVTTL